MTDFLYVDLHNITTGNRSHLLFPHVDPDYQRFIVVAMIVHFSGLFWIYAHFVGGGWSRRLSGGFLAYVCAFLAAGHMWDASLLINVHKLPGGKSMRAITVTNGVTWSHHAWSHRLPGHKGFMV